MRTDLAIEFAKDIRSDYENDFLKRTYVQVDKDFSAQTGKAMGDYITLESCVVKKGMRPNFKAVAAELAKAIKELMQGKSVLIVGLGNPDITADSLGKRVLGRVMITRHLKLPPSALTVSGICPNVLGVTGIESFDIVKGVVMRTKPDCVLVVDSLAGAATTRIASAFQVSNAGITPGSGVSNHRARLDVKSLGCTVVSVGVPLVVYASTIIEDAYGGNADDYDREIANMIVTPKDIDLYVEDCAQIIASAINLAFFDTDFGL